MIIINTKFLKATIEQECRLYKNSEEYKKLDTCSFSENEKTTIRILSVYRNTKEKLIKREIDLLKKEKSIDKTLQLLFEQSRDIISLESELFKTARSEVIQDDALNAYCGMISNDNIDLLELIEIELE